MRIAVTSGHRYSVAAAFDHRTHLADGKQFLVVSRGPAINIHGVARDHVKALGGVLTEILDKLLGEMAQTINTTSLTLDDRLVLALPGVSSTRDMNVANACIESSNWPKADPANYCIIDDTYAGLIAGSLSTVGICAFAGSGASVYMGTANGEIRAYNGLMKLPFKRDGYGPLLGDHGSGFRLGMTALERICRFLDTLTLVQPPPFHQDVIKLMEEMAKKTGECLIDGEPGVVYEDENPLQAWFEQLMADRSPEWRIQVASLAEVITSAADAGNKFAQELIDASAEEMFKTLDDALRLDEFTDLHGAPIYCQGGMFRYSLRYIEKVKQLLQGNDWSNPIELARYAPGVGSLLLAVSSNWSIPNDADRDAVLRAVESVGPEGREMLFNDTPPGPRS